MKTTAIAAIALLAAAAGCTQRDAPGPRPAPALQTYKVASKQVPVYIEATGTVQADLEGGARILPPVAGIVERIDVKVGDAVKRGTPLAELRSPDVSDAWSGYLSAQAQLRQAERTFDVNRKLFEVGAVTRNDLLASEAGYEQAKALAEGFAKKLEIYGAAPSGGQRQTLTLRAPIDGRVAEVQAHVGDRFDTGSSLMTLANARRNVVVANIYDTDLPRLGKGGPVSFTSDVVPDREFGGTISYIGDVEDPDSKTVKVYIRLREQADVLKQNMFLRIRLPIGQKVLPVVPKTSVLYKEGKFFVTVSSGGQTSLREVVPAMDVSDRMMAVEGLRDGEEIVASAIDLEKP